MSSTGHPARLLNGPPAKILAGLSVSAPSMVSIYRVTFASRAPGCPASDGSSRGPGINRAVASSTTSASCGSNTEQGPADGLPGCGRRRRAASGQQLGRKQDGEAREPRSLQHLAAVEDCHGQESSHH